ncbi:prolyl aminopeptidase [Corynebacterium pygosceleis]|uniref:Proline iminopeptidase n=1 Tax=Corynebacterium pygosceleis TaxID=2800406 RepID=A0A9Q4C6J1_9CORY|nr:prolyl aminopeptidase [Corynebacterium pygosceleis]MCK7636581.1 prolyl aminopeptidase [Corynebacterium pygosceleis]MCK7675155.1 prolyl aminopeptidase [Corynebacterium pygosceleis]MCL0120628.1 prolyl aminopeptidase [Corynebacterium pygosceleis]MCX7467334.1 prolyl aminopeptidase [Corynebacterium pygosceleis]
MPTELHPQTDAHDSGRLDVGDGQLIHYGVHGNPEGRPVVVVHGGPGGAGDPAAARFFDPGRYRVIMFDQRGCGRSTPHLADPGTDTVRALETNTTAHLISDMEKLREHLGVESWQVFGGSWGSTLSLAYAQTHPERVRELVLRGVFLLRRSELDWFYNGGADHIFPDLWEGYLDPVRQAHGGDVAGLDLIAEYHRLLSCTDRSTALRAARAWTTWEKSTSTLRVPPGVDDGLSDDYALAFARIENHYFMHGAFLRDGQLLEKTNIDRIRHIPAVIVQGRYDVVCPVRSAWDLHRAWPEADLTICPASGHSQMEREISRALVAATDRFADGSATGS